MQPLFQFKGTDRFEVLDSLGEGGMGVVYLAQDRERRTRVALKALRSLGPDSVLRFKTEFRALQDIEHPNLVSLGELVEDKGRWFFTMEYVDGVSFLEYVRPSHASMINTSSFSFDTSELRGLKAGGGKLIPDMTSPGPNAASGGSDFHERRLRLALAQLIQGLMALHAAGKVHRDIKPSNIMITREGRVVIMDFGLVAESRRDEPLSEIHVVGTTAYMAPEQAASKRVGPPADWYSVGVLLYEALTGRLPFSGAPLEVLMKKQTERPVQPIDLVPGIPADLDDLCMSLLDTEPGARPGGEVILERLHVEPSVVRRMPQPPAPAETDAARTFVGRERELSFLTKAFRDVREGGSVTVYVHGESGVGKSALVERFIELLAIDGRNVVLSGRCYERETVHYKAVDDVVDSLAKYMSRLPPAEAAALLPMRVGLLADVFPVLRRVEVVAQAPRDDTEKQEPQEVRRRVFQALRELLVRLSDRQRLVVVIEDLQWADADSLALLSEVMRPPEAPQLLLVATTRRESTELRSPYAAGTPAAAAEGEIRHLEVGALPPDAARQLVQALITRSGKAVELDVAQVAVETGGHPLFIDELVGHILSTGGASRFGQQRLEDALWARISDLEPAARRLLDLVAVASSPTRQEVIAKAASLSQGEYAKRVAVLRAANLVRTTGSRSTDLVEPYHDRVRDAVAGYLADDKRVTYHRRLAIALEAAHWGDAETLAGHWHAAGEEDKAAKYALEAGQQAMAGFAFERGARMLKWSVSLRAPLGPEAQKLYTSLGDALSNSGKALDAAEAYLAAAQVANAAEARELERRAGEQLLRCGHIDRGLDVLRRPMQELGVHIAKSPRSALVGLLTRRAQLRLRGIRYTPRDERAVPSDLLKRIDSSWSVCVGLGIVDTIRGADMATRNLLWSLKSGEPYRIARALAVESAFYGTQGPSKWAHADALVNRASELAEGLGHPHARGMAMLMRGINQFQRTDFAKCRDLCQEAAKIFVEGCAGATWEINNANVFRVWSIFMLGDLDRAAEIVPRLVQEATERGDLYTVASLRSGVANQLWLMNDQPEAARREANDALRGWSHKGFHIQHTYDMLAHGQLQLYEGDVRDISRRLETEWPLLVESMLMRVDFVAMSQYYLRGRVSVRMAAQTSGSEREHYAKLAERDAGKLDKTGRPWGQGTARILWAGLAEVRGDVDGAMRHLMAASPFLDALGLKLLKAATTYRRAVLMGGIAGKALHKELVPFLEAQRIKVPAKFMRVFVPGKD